MNKPIRIILTYPTAPAPSTTANRLGSPRSSASSSGQANADKQEFQGLADFNARNLEFYKQKGISR